MIPTALSTTHYPKTAILTDARISPAALTRLDEQIRQQTHGNCVRVLVSPRNDQPDALPVLAEDAIPDGWTLLTEKKVAEYLRSESVEFFFAWQPHFQAQSTALEKLVWALTSLTSRHLVTGNTTQASFPVLGRCEEETLRLAGAIAVQESNWKERCLDHQLSGFMIEESLFTPIDPEFPRGEVHDSLTALFPLNIFTFENYQPVPIEPPFAVDTSAPDSKSILLLVSSLPMGGACKFNLDVVESLIRRGYRITICSTAHYPNPWLDEFLKFTPDVFLLPRYVSAIDFPRFITHLIRSRQVGRVFLTHSMLAYHLLPFLKSQSPDVSFVDYTHIEYETEWPHGGYASVSVGCQSLLDLSIASSNHLKEWMVEHGGNAEKIRVCHTNIDPEKWKPSPETRSSIRKELNIPDKTAMLLYACRIADQKRPDLMCEIIHNLTKATRSPFVLIIAGDGERLSQVKKFFMDNKLMPWVRFLGAVKLEKVAKLHDASDIFFLPSKLEGISLALFEAMALESVPVVADVGGQRELVNADCGYLVPHGPNEVKEYTRILKDLIENRDKLRQMATRCRTHVSEAFNLAQMTETLLAHLEEADRRHASQPTFLPPPHYCREVATLAMDHVRLICQGGSVFSENRQLTQALTSKDKMIERLQDKLRQTLQRQPA